MADQPPSSVDLPYRWVIPVEIRERVFRVVLHTKEKSRGTGLCLAMVFGFVKQSGGHVTIYSEVGHAAATSTSAAGHVDLDARETTLVVEDDERVRQLTISTATARFGHMVATGRPARAPSCA